MKAIKQILRATLIAAVAGLLPLTAQSQEVSMSDMQTKYKADIQRCATLADPERQRTCRREAGAALQEARRQRLMTGHTDSDKAANAVARCQRLAADQRANCEQLMRDSGTIQHGSVEGGGVLRELTITVPASTTPR